MNPHKDANPSAPVTSESASSDRDDHADGGPTELDSLAFQFVARIEGLRELLDVISPHVDALDGQEGIQSTIDQSGLSTTGKEIVRNLFVPDPENGSEDRTRFSFELVAPDDVPGDKDSQTMEEVTSGSGDVVDERHEGIAEEVESEVPPEIQAFVDLTRKEPIGVSKVLQRFTQSAMAPRASLLHGSLLTVAVASFEFLLAGLHSHHLLAYPKQMQGDDPEFSLADLVELGSIDEARRILVERRVDGFMRRGLGDWSRWCERALGESFESLCLNYTDFNEVFQRRHIVVHNGGIVSRLYLERVEFPSDGCPELGEELPVSASYMRAALDELEVLGHGLIALARSKWGSGHGDRAGALLNNHVFELMQARRWDLACKLADIGCTLKAPEMNKLMFEVNRWLAVKRLGRFAECRGAVDEWDVSALGPQFKLARACLLDDHEDALVFLSMTIHDSDFKPHEVWRWPLIDDLKADPRCLEAFDEAGYQPAGQGSDKGGLPDADRSPSSST